MFPPLRIALFGLDAIETLTAALVAITGYYAWQNRRMATELRRSREALIRPKLAVDVHLLTPMFAMARVTNVGQGPALDVDVELAFEPAPDSGAKRVVKGWRANVIAPGEHHDFQPPEDVDLEPLVRSWNRITLNGRMEDASGAKHKVDEETTDLLELWKRIKELGILWTEDPARVTARETKEIRKKISDLAKKAREVRRVVTG
jgi:hypothetical protein